MNMIMIIIIIGHLQSAFGDAKRFTTCIQAKKNMQRGNADIEINGLEL